MVNHIVVKLIDNITLYFPNTKPLPTYPAAIDRLSSIGIRLQFPRITIALTRFYFRVRNNY